MNRPESLLRRWVGPALVLAAAPKCGLCLLAYAGLATGAGAELCGATLPASVTPAWLPIAGALAAAVFFLCRTKRRSPPART